MYTAHQITRKDVESIGAKIYVATKVNADAMTARGWECLGYNAGIYGWNWTAWLSKDHTTVLMDAYRNTPKAAEHISQSDLASIL